MRRSAELIELSDWDRTEDVALGFWLRGLLAEGALDKREVGMKLALKGFYEKTVMYKSGTKRTSKRVYELAFSGGASLATLVP